VDRSWECRSLVGPIDHAGDGDAPEAVAHEMEADLPAARHRLHHLLDQSMAGRLSKCARAVLHLPEGELAQRGEQGGKAEAAKGSHSGAGARRSVLSVLECAIRVERLAVAARRSRRTIAPQL